MERLKNIVFSNPKLNEHFLVDCNYIVNVDKTNGIVGNEGISFDRNPNEPASLRWEKLTKFTQRNKYCAVEERIGNLSDIPDEFLDTVDESSKIRFVIQHGKDDKKQDYIYSGYEIKLIKRF